MRWCISTKPRFVGWRPAIDKRFGMRRRKGSFRKRPGVVTSKDLANSGKLSVSVRKGLRRRGINVKSGTCHLCGKQTDRLSRDHIQPQCAFNEKHRTYVRMESIQSMAIRKNEAVTGPTVRNIYIEIQPDRPIAGGIYRYTQCTDCNGLLGSLYDQRFGVWSHDALGLLKPGEVIVVQREYFQKCQYPLSILKRIVAMFFSINGERFASCQPELSAFVRDSQSQQLPLQFSFFAAYNVNDLVSHIPLQTRTDVRVGKNWLISQIAHPPFVYAMTINSACPDPRLTDITGFAKYGYDEEGSLELVLRVVPTNSCLAGDYRAAGKLLEDDMLVLISEVMPSYFRIVDAVI